MKTYIENIISGLNSQLDYVLNNDDFTSNYDHIVSEQLTYNQNGNNDYSILVQLLEYFNIEYNEKLLDVYYQEWINYYMDFGNFEVEVRSVGYENMIENDCFLQIGIDEQEFHIADDFDKNIFKKGIQEYINNNTDFYCTGGHAYIDLYFYYILYKYNKDDLQTVIDNVNEV